MKSCLIIQCRVNYDTKSWGLIGNKLMEDHTAIPALQRAVMLPILPELVMSPRCPSIHLALPSWFLPQETLTMVLAYRELEKDFGALLAFKECLDSKGAATANERTWHFNDVI